jgi:hypothetical protein
MRKFIPFFFVLLLSFSLVLAVDVSVQPNELARNGTLVSTIRISGCVGASAVEINNDNNQLVQVGQGLNAWQLSYNINSDPTDGKYEVEVSCADGTTESARFCVNEPGCLDGGVVPAGGGQPEPQVQSSGGRGGFKCSAKWGCSKWSTCSADLKQTRTCTDSTRCVQKPKVEERACAECIESWTCSSWSDCKSGKNTRTCTDQNYCKSIKLKPELQKKCDDVPGPAPISKTKTPPPKKPFISKELPGASAGFSIKDFWNDNMGLILGIVGGLVGLALIIVLVIHFFVKPKEHKVHNYDELKKWIEMESAAGTSDTDIHEILAQETDWPDEDVAEVFRELKTEHSQKLQQEEQQQPKEKSQPVVDSQSSSQPAVV